jgi:hypothetical protein
MSQVTASSVITNTLTSGGNTISIPKNVTVSGNIDFAGNLLQNGAPFASLPPQNFRTSGAMLMSDGGNAFWAYPGETETAHQMPDSLATTGAGVFNGRNPTVSAFLPFSGTGSWVDFQGNNYTVTIGSSFRYRSIFTHGFMAGGYRGSNPWRTVCQTYHATDITISRGDQLDRAASYVDGNFSDYNGYVYGTQNAYDGSGIHTSSINLHTGTGRTFGDTVDYGHSDGYNTTPDTLGTSWDLWNGVNDAGAISGQLNQRGYVTGSGSAGNWQRLNFATEVMSRFGGGSNGAFCSAFEGETRGYVFANTGDSRFLTFSNESTTAWSTTGLGGDGWKKSLSTKWGHGYHGNAPNVTLPWMKVNDLTGANISIFNQPDIASGEENSQMGQDWGYCLGNYANPVGGYQNNRTWKRFYATDADIQLGFKSEPKGHLGTSSGACSSASFTVTAKRYQ